MNPIRREVLNGLFVLVLSTLLSAAIAAFQVKFNLPVWTFIAMGVAIAVSGYVVFEYVLSTEAREIEWLKRVGTPARLELNREGEPAGLAALGEVVKAMKPGSDYTVLYYIGAEGGGESLVGTEAPGSRETLFGALLEQVKQSKVREYKRIICFDRDVLANDQELRSGVLRVGEGPGTIDRTMGEHCRLMVKTKGCSLYVAPAVFRSIVVFLGVDKVSITVETAAQDTGGRTTRGVFFFCDPPNGEIIEQFRQMERETERRMVAVHEIVFPEDAAPRAELAAR